MGRENRTGENLHRSDEPANRAKICLAFDHNRLVFHTVAGNNADNSPDS